MKPEELIKEAILRMNRKTDLDQRLYDKAWAALNESLIIPKPKFKVGDITLPKGAKQAFQVDLRNYNLPFGNWAYYDSQTGVWWWEHELELV